MGRKTGLFICVGLISSLGLTTIWSTVPNLFWAQTIFLIVGLFIAYIFYKLDLTVAFSLSALIYLFTILLLFLTLFFGSEARGATRWFFGFQTSEIAKPLLALSYAGYLVNNRLDKLKNLIVYVFFTLIPIILVRQQPDLGSALVLFALAAFMGLFAGIKLRWVVLLTSLLLLFIPLAPYFLHDYQLDRIESFLNPYHDPRGKGYNVIQSVIAIGSGGLIGKGVRLGTQSHLNFLPERHTDFVFASFSEEFGLLGIVLVIASYYYLLSLLISTALKVKEPEHRLLAIGIMSIFLFQVVVNIGMNLGLMPVTGITLPLFSYGGSSLISFLALLGLSARLLELMPSHRI